MGSGSAAAEHLTNPAEGSNGEGDHQPPLVRVDLYHWSSERFSAAWRTTISVLVAKGRARVGVADARCSYRLAEAYPRLAVLGS